MNSERKNRSANPTDTPCLGFTCFSRQDYYPQLKDLHLSMNEHDSVLLGLYCDDGSCKAEMSMTWRVLQTKPVPRLEIFSDGFCLLGEKAFKELFSELERLEDPNITPDEFSKLLLRLGFRDLSDKPLVQQ